MKASGTTNSSAPVTPQPEDPSPCGAPLDRTDLAVTTLLIGCVVALFWKVIFTPSMFFYRDVCNYTYPTARFIQEACRHGSLPFWNPYLNYGQPILANPNLLFFYPYTLFILLLPIDLAYTLHYVTHIALAGIGTYLLARRWGQSRRAAFFAAFVFTFSGPVLSLGNVYNHAACATWIPWALLLTHRAIEGRSIRPWILLTLVFSLQFLAGEPLTLIATFGLALAYAFYRRGTFRPLWSPPNLRILTGFFLAGCLMVALCAVQFLPAADLLAHSRRGSQGLRYMESANWALHPLALAEVVLPGFFGSTLSSSTPWTWMVGDNNVPYFQALFVGFVPLFFALAGWALGQDRRRGFVSGAAVVFLLLSFGHFTPVFALTYLLIPLLVLVRFPVKLFVLVVLLTAILAGWGVDALRQEASRWKAQRQRILLPLKVLLACWVVIWVSALLAPKLITSSAAWALLAAGHDASEVKQMVGYLLTILRVSLPGLAGFTLSGLLIVVGLEQKKAWASAGLWLFALLGLAQLVQVNCDANPTVPKSFYTHRPAVLLQLKNPAGTYRVTSLARKPINPNNPGDLQRFINFESVPEAAGFSPLAQAAFQDKILLAVGSMLSEVEGSINLDLERSLPPYLYDVWIYQNRQAAHQLQIDCLLGRTNVKYIIQPVRRDSTVTRLVSELFNGSPEPSYLYEDLCWVPRAYVAGASLFTTSSLETLRHLSSPDFDARHVVILAAEPGTAPAAQSSSAAGRVEVVDRQPNAVTLHAELLRPGYVVLLDRYDPNWHASLDGREVPVLRANQLFRAVFADAGRHEIRFYYRQRGLTTGLAISLATLALLLFLYFKR
jgi:hypothetical protein